MSIYKFHSLTEEGKKPTVFVKENNEPIKQKESNDSQLNINEIDGTQCTKQEVKCKPKRIS